MLKIKPHYLLLLSSLLAGCSLLPQPVGGSCEYKTTIGVAQIRAKDDRIVATFNSPDFQTKEAHQLEFMINRPEGGTLYSTYPARLQSIISGTCTPYLLTLFGIDQQRYDGLFIAFDKEGRLAEPEVQKVAQVATTHGFLEHNGWQLSLCSQTNPEGVSEYNLSLSERYGQRIKQLLQENGVPARQITVVNHGEDGCTPPCSLFITGKNGVCINFQVK